MGESSRSSDSVAELPEEKRLLRRVASFRLTRLSVDSLLPSVYTLRAAILRADVVAFTSLTDRMVLTQVGGAEELAARIKDLVDRIAILVQSHGGELATLAGDAAIAVWFSENDSALSRAILLAVEAALAIQDEVQSARFSQVPIALRATVGGGPMRHFEVGGLSEEWHAVLSGTPLVDAAAASTIAAPGQTVLAASAWNRVRTRCRGSVLANGMLNVHGVLAPAERTPLVRPSVSIPPQRLRGVLPAIILDEESDGRFAGNFRTVSAVFISISDPNYALDDEALNWLQEITLRVQRVLRKFEGQLHQLRADDDRLTIIAVFGLPPWSHEDDAARAVQAALALHKDHGELGITTSTGIATGRVFCASIGPSDSAGMFTLVGPSMNLAARLMQLNAGVVCDSATARTGRQSRHIAVKRLAPRPIKGKAEEVVAFVPYGIVPDDRSKSRSAQDLIGRAGETAALTTALQELRQGRPGLVVVEGEPGIGKSTLVDQLLATARPAGVRSVLGAASDTERAAPYFAWSSIVRDLFGLASLTWKGHDPEVLTELIAQLGSDAVFAPLLAEVIGVPISENVDTMRLTGELRAATTRRILITKFAKAAAAAPLIVVVEDAHWLDSSSSVLLAELAEATLPLLLVVTARHKDSELAFMQRALALTHCRHVVLRGLDADETGLLLAASLGAARTAPEVSNFVQERTSGNPLFIAEIVPVLRDTGLLTVVADEVVTRDPVAVASQSLDHALARSGVPATLEGIMMSRVDRLPGAEQIVLQMASVLGRVFVESDLRTAIAKSKLGSDPAKALHLLTKLSFVTPLEDPGGFQFNHAILRDAVYNSLSFTDRRRLHKAAAEVIQQGPAGRAGQSDAILAHHFHEAGADELALVYLVSAGRRALKVYANTEALTLLSYALDTVRRVASSSPRANLPKWRGEEAEIELALGRTNHRLSKYGEARAHAEAGLKLLRFPVPASRLRLATALLGGVLKQITRRWTKGLTRRLDAERRQLLSIVASALEYLTDIYYFSDEGLKAGYAAVRMLNLAQRAEDHAAIGLGYVNFAGIAGVAGFDLLADSYRRRALSELPLVEDVHAAIWLPFLVGVTLVGSGEWARAMELLAQAKAAAEKADDRRSWCAAVEMIGAIAACRGDWHSAHAEASAFLAAAERDRDQRVSVAALRELGYYNLQLGRWEEAKANIAAINLELERGVTVEERTIRMEVLAMNATLHLETGDPDRANIAACEALPTIERNGVSFPMSYWTAFMIARVFLILAQRNTEFAQSRDHRRRIESACRALQRQARVYKIARPSAALAAGALEQLNGRADRATKHWRRCISDGSMLAMSYERALAEGELARIEGRDSPPLSTYGLSVHAEPVSVPVLPGT